MFRRRPRAAGVRLWVAPLALAALALFALIAGLLDGWPARPAGAQQPVLEEDIVQEGRLVGRFYRLPGDGGALGFEVREPFLTPFLELGGPPVAGYPGSTPFLETDGCLYQSFQVLLLQACPGAPVRLANTFEILEGTGADGVLLGLGVGSAEQDTATSFVEAVGIRLGWLQEARIRDRYLQQCGNGDPSAAVERCGLPMNRPQTFGPFISQRFQRVTFQHWLVDGPAGIRAGDVTPALGGDLLKATGVLAGPPVRPHARAEPPSATLNPFVTVASAAPTLPGPAVDFRDRATLGIILRQVDTAEGEAPAAFRPGAQGQDLVVGDRVRTDVTGNALVTYFEGTTAEVSPSSVVTVERLTTGQDGRPQTLTLQQLAGEVIYRFTRALRPGSTVEIRTPSAVATVRGTAVRVTVGPGGETRIEVFSGKVEVAAGGIVIVLYAGTFTDVLPGQPPSPAAPFTLFPSPQPISLTAPPDPAASAAPDLAGTPGAGTPGPGPGTPGAGTAVPGTTTSPTATPTTPTPTPSPTLPPSATATSRPSESSGGGDSGGGSSSTNTPTPTQTTTPGEPTPLPTQTATPDPTATPSSTPTPSPTATPPPTSTSTPSPTPTNTPSATATPAQCPEGTFLAQWFDNQSLTGLPRLTRCEASIDYSLGPGSPDPLIPADSFSARWQGQFRFEAGSYTFSATADDGVRVFVDDIAVIDAWFEQSATTYTQVVPLSAGTHSVRVEYFEGGGAATIRAGWSLLATPTPTAVPTSTATPPPTATATPSPAPSSTPTATATPTPVPTGTPTPTSTRTPQDTLPALTGAGMSPVTR